VSDSVADRLAIADVLLGYGASIDRGDWAALRTVLADDLVAQYADGEPLEGADTVVAWIRGSTRTALWQQHFLSVAEVVLDGDTASALVNHTSHRVVAEEPDIANVNVGRYHDELRRGDDGWRISRLRLELLWSERRAR
jgi:hypothetical protein